MQHARVAIYTLTSGTIGDVSRKAEQGMLPVFAEQPGFIRYGLIECGNQAVSISLWETEAEASAANAVAVAWVRDNIAQNVRLETAYVGDLAFFSPAPALV
jgi:hypothetical protein